MSENENIENEIKDDEMLEEAADIEAASDAPVEEDVAIVEDGDDEADEIAAEAEKVVEAADAVAEAVDGDAEADEADEEESKRDLGEELIAKIKRAEGLLFRRRIAMERAAEEKASQVNELARAIKLLDLKPKMEQKEMADLLGVRLRELDALLADAEKCDLVGRVEVTDPETGNVDMRKVVVFASEDAVDHVGDIARQTEPVVPGLSNEDMELLFAQLDKVINPLVAMGLEDERGGRDDRGGRGGFGAKRDDRGGRGGFGGRGGDRRDSGDRSHGKFGSPRMGFGGSRGGHSDRGGFGGRDRDDRGSRGGFGGGRGGYGDRGGRGGYGDRGGFGGRDRY